MHVFNRLNALVGWIVLRAWREGIGRIASAPSAGLAEAPAIDQPPHASEPLAEPV